jgi:NTE family protein
MDAEQLRQVPLFAGLSAGELEGVAERMRQRSYAAGELIFREGEPGHTLLLLTGGLVRVSVAMGEAEQGLARLHRGDVLGEMSLLTGEPRMATARAVLPTEALELEPGPFRELLSRHPPLLDNLVRLLRERLSLTNRRGREQGQASLLIADATAWEPAQEVLQQAVACSPRRHAVFAPSSPTGILPARPLLEAIRAGRDALALLPLEAPGLAQAIEMVDRAVLIGGPEQERLLRSRLPPGSRLPEVAGGGAGLLPRVVGPAEPAWLGRYLARCRLGLALGAGGARGFAHVGALLAWEAQGLRYDALAGSSIGGVVAALLAMGKSAAQVEDCMRAIFMPEHVRAFFRLALGAQSPAMELWVRLLREATEDRRFEELPIPLTVMCTDLHRGEPAPLREGPVWEALLATTALPGMAPPVLRGSQRLVDGLALVPVPTEAAGAPHADLRLAINLMSRRSPELEEGHRGSSALDTLLEALELTHTASSCRHAEQAELCLSPDLGASTWKDFHRAEDFIEAGRRAAVGALPALRGLVRLVERP